MKYLLYIFALGLVMSSCYKQTYWLDDNVDTDGFFYPQIQSVTPSNDAPDEGETITITAKYWSRDAVKQVDVYHDANGTDELYSSNPFESHLDKEDNVEAWPLEYVVPAGTSGKDITIRIVVVTENDLEKSKSTKITVN